MTSSPIHTRMLTGFIFCKSYAKKHSYQECIRVTVLPYPGNAISHQSPNFCFLQSFCTLPWALGRWAQERDEHSVWCSGQLWLCQLLTAAGFQLDDLQGVRVMIPFFPSFSSIPYDYIECLVLPFWKYLKKLFQVQILRCLHLLVKQGFHKKHKNGHLT